MRNRRNKRTIKNGKKVHNYSFDINLLNNNIKIISSLCVILGLVFFSVIFSLLNMTNSKIINGIKIEKIDVSGLTAEQAKEKIQKWYDEVVLKNITLKYEDIEEDINLNEFEPTEKIDKAVNEALKVGRSGNIITNNYAILFSLITHKNLDIGLSYNEEKLNNKIEEISGKLPGAVVQSSYYIDGEDLIIKKGTDGIEVNIDNLKKQVKDQIKKDTDKTIQIPVKQTSPEAIDIEKIYSEIYREQKDAYIEENPTKVVAQVDGVDFAISIEEAKKIIAEDKDEYIIPLNITIPKVTLDKLGEKAFPEKLSEFVTRYDASNENRSTNIQLASDKIDGTIVKPGETFSYNKIVGERTLAKGYKEATVFAGGKLVQGVGGGICQLSSTLYNAALYANMDITKRSNHRFLTAYVPEGRDATVSWGTIDFCFVNTRRYPVKIVSKAQNGILKVQFMRNKRRRRI